MESLSFGYALAVSAASSNAANERKCSLRSDGRFRPASNFAAVSLEQRGPSSPSNVSRRGVDVCPAVLAFL